MEGNNELQLCSKEMINAMQLYVDKLMPNEEGVRVLLVNQLRDECGTFVIKIGEDENE